MYKRWVGRRLLAVVAVSAAGLGVLAGCGDDDDSSGSAGSGGAATASSGSASSGIGKAKEAVKVLESNAPLKVASLPKPLPKGKVLAVVNCTIPACQPGDIPGAASAAGFEHKNFDYDLTKGPPDYQRAVRQAIASKPDAALIVAVYPESLIAKDVATATKAGVKVVDIGGVKSPDYIACIQCLPATKALGVAMGNVAIADAGSKTSIGVVLDKANAPLVATAEGVEAAAKENGEGTKVQRVDNSFADPPSANAARTVSFLQRNPDVKYLMYTTPSLLPGVNGALAAAGLAGRVKIIASSPSNAGDVQMAKDGQVFAWVAGEGSGHHRAIDAAARGVLGAPIDPFAPVPPFRVITKANATPDLINPKDYEAAWTKAWQGAGA